jgi:hypothetical protein
MPSLPCASCGKYVTIKATNLRKRASEWFVCFMCVRDQAEGFICDATTRAGGKCRRPRLEHSKLCWNHHAVAEGEE